MNHFGSSNAAARYVQGRPYFHPWVKDAILDHLPDGFRFRRGLDVACGTGMSTRMLADIAHEVVGIDLSEAMINQAYRAPNIEYRLGPAEKLPEPNASFDVVTVALALHWFDRAQFLAEAFRVLEPEGRLIVYNHKFAGEMASNPRFSEWHANEYLKRFPPPKRNERNLDDTDAKAAGFRSYQSNVFKTYWPYTPSEVADYFCSQSNVISLVDAGRESQDEVHAWLVSQIKAFFTYEREVFRYHGVIGTVQK